MNITRSGSQLSSQGPPEYFTGTVRVDSQFQRSAPARVAGPIVTFEPGARTAWHTHPSSPGGLRPAGPPYTLARGDPFDPAPLAWAHSLRSFAADCDFASRTRATCRRPNRGHPASPERPYGREGGHWHGPSPDAGMTHIAIQEQPDGKVVEWMEHVTDEQYRVRWSEHQR